MPGVALDARRDVHGPGPHARDRRRRHCRRAGRRRARSAGGPRAAPRVPVRELARAAPLDRDRSRRRAASTAIGSATRPRDIVVRSLSGTALISRAADARVVRDRLVAVQLDGVEPDGCGRRRATSAGAASTKTPTRATNGGSAVAIARARSAVIGARTRRPEHEPERVAPSSTASAASSRRVMPQILTRTRHGRVSAAELGRQRVAASAAPGSGSVMNRSPTRNASIAQPRAARAGRPPTSDPALGDGDDVPAADAAPARRRHRRSTVERAQVAAVDADDRRRRRRARAELVARRAPRRARPAQLPGVARADARSSRSSSAATISSTASAPAARASTI